MQVSIKRLKTNSLYTEGTLSINGEHQTYTVEATETMLPSGAYTLGLVKRNAHCRELVVQDTGCRIGIGSSFINSRRERMICIGQPLIPGALYKATPDYERIVKRLEKCQERNETINLFITDSDCTRNQPISHWLRTPAIVIVVVIVGILTSCSSLHNVAVVEHATHDTLYVNTIQYDSIYIDQWQYRDRSSDTIYLEKVRLEYKYRLLKDTVRVVSVDSIPVIHEVEVTKTVKSIPTIYRISLWTCIGLIVLIISFILLKLFLK